MILSQTTAQSPSVGVKDRDAWSFEVTKDTITDDAYRIPKSGVTLDQGDPMFLTILEDPSNGIVKMRIDTDLEEVRINQSLAEFGSYFLFTDWEFWGELTNFTVGGNNYTITAFDGQSTMSFELLPEKSGDASLFISYFKSSGVMSEYQKTLSDTEQIILKNTTGSDPASVNFPVFGFLFATFSIIFIKKRKTY